MRTAQGSRGAPLSWAAVMELLARVVQSLYYTDAGFEGHLQVYVDDPLLAVKGGSDGRRLLAARFIAAFTVLGVRLAYPKAQFGFTVTWIGVQLTVKADAVEARIPLDKLQDLLQLIRALQTSNVAAIKDVGSLAGKATNIATLLYQWRPFLSQLWASLFHS